VLVSASAPGGPVPQHCPSPRELDDLELLLSGALAPRASFDRELTLELPPELLGLAQVDLVDPEGLPLARRDAHGRLTALSEPTYGAFRRLHLSPARAIRTYGERLVVAVFRPPNQRDLEQIRVAAHEREVLLLALVGQGTPREVSAVALLRTCLVAADELARHGIETDVVAVPLASHGDRDLDERLRDTVVHAYAAAGRTWTQPLAPGPSPLPARIREVVAQDQPPEDERGLVVFFTGLSGSGKSTLARALHDLVVEDGSRTVTSLDGDVVRRHLSAGLGFSREDRETNILRIGWVAAEIARNRGLAICSPIAPFDSTRREVRAMVEEAGGSFVLVHVATPLEECERRDRKGLYARARAGEIPDFTGISSPYEPPTDAAVRIDTTGRSIEDCLAVVVDALYFTPTPPDPDDGG
jgi:sulfate adenylyltransferase